MRGKKKYMTEEEYLLLQEEKKMRKLKVVVDLTAAVLKQGTLSKKEALQLIRATREFALKLFPGKEETYDLIYKPRFERILKERYK